MVICSLSALPVAYIHKSHETLTFIIEQENALLERVKKYIADNKKFLVMGLIAMSGDYRAYHAYRNMQNN